MKGETPPHRRSMLWTLEKPGLRPQPRCGFNGDCVGGMSLKISHVAKGLE